MAATYPKPLPQQWWFTTWGVQDKLWPSTQGKGVTVAVLDSGVQANLPDFSGVVLPGKDLTGGNDDARVDDDPDFGHGTLMASLIASQGTGTGFVGVAPAAKILPLRTKSYESMVAAIRYAADQGARVINISQGSPAPCANSLQEAVGYAIQHDVVVVSSSGDDGDETNSSESPSNCAGVLSVGAVDPGFRPWTKTQRQPYVAVAAPGLAVGGVIRSGQFAPSGHGTSQASALTSAVAALVRSKFPDMSARQVVQQIIGSAGDVGPKGKDDQTGYGLIRPYRILNGSVPKSGPNPVFAAYDQWAAANGKNAGGAAPRSSANDKEPKNYVGLGVIVAMVLALGIVLFVVLGRNRRRPQMAGAGRHRGQAMPPPYGGPYPPQGGQAPPPGAQQPYYPPQGPHGAPPPGQYPNPGQWDTPDQRQ
jgi:type VII secretion-associated serine protease mycosin